MDSVLKEFTEICQWKGSIEAAKAHIEAANGNLEMALALYYDNLAASSAHTTNSGSAPASGTTTSRRNLTHLSGNSDSHLTRGSRSSQVPRMSLMEELNDEYKKDLVKLIAPRAANAPTVYAVRFLTPFSLLISVVDRIFGALTSWIWQHIPFAWPSVERSQEETFATYVVPQLSKLGINKPFPRQLLQSITYNDALELLKSELKFLLVVITCEVHESPPSQFIHRILETNIQSRSDTYVWFCSALSTEGYRLAQAFSPSQLPMALFIGPSPKTANSSVIVMECLLQLSGADALDSDYKRRIFMEDVDRVVQDHEPRLLSLKLHRQHNDSNRKIREEQDSAYQRSLESDRQRAEKARQEEEDRKLSSRRHNAWLASIKAKANAYLTSPPTEGARVSLRLPNGERFNIRIPGDKPVSDIYDISYVQLNKEELANVEPNHNLPSDLDLTGYSPYKFTLMSTVLRGPLPSSATKVKEIDALWPSGVLMVDMD